MTPIDRDGHEPAQLRLELGLAPDFDRARFVVSDSNRLAVEAVDAWPDWPGCALALVGPAGSGKTHLAMAWAARSGAHLIESRPVDIGRLPRGPLVLEDADRCADETALFHLINRAQAGESLLLTARRAPRTWETTLPDLRSRLNAIPAPDLGPPDDAVLQGVLIKLFKERNIRPEPEVLPYLLRRMERSIPAAMLLVDRLDRASDALGRGVTRALAREVLEATPPAPEAGG